MYSVFDSRIKKAPLVWRFQFVLIRLFSEHHRRLAKRSQIPATLLDKVQKASAVAQLLSVNPASSISYPEFLLITVKLSKRHFGCAVEAIGAQSVRSRQYVEAGRLRVTAGGLWAQQINRHPARVITQQRLVIICRGDSILSNTGFS
ncbi:uncharacterized [Tachysurus ichikawai]